MDGKERFTTAGTEDAQRSRRRIGKTDGSKRDSSLRDPARQKAARRKSRVTSFGMTRLLGGAIRVIWDLRLVLRLAALVSCGGRGWGVFSRLVAGFCLGNAGTGVGHDWGSSSFLVWNSTD